MEQPRKLDSGKWQARYTGPDGERHTAGTHATKKAAQRAAAKALTDIPARWYRSYSTMTRTGSAHSSSSRSEH